MAIRWHAWLLGAAAATLASGQVRVVDLGPVDKNGNGIPVVRMIATKDEHGMLVFKGYVYSREELLAMGAVPASIKAPVEPPGFSCNARVLLREPAVRKECGFAKDDLAAVPLAIEALMKLETKYESRVAVARTKGQSGAAEREEYRGKERELLKEAFAGKADRLIQLSRQFSGIELALASPGERKELGVSDSEHKAWLAAMAKLSAPSASVATAPPLPATYQDAEAQNQAAYRQLEKLSSERTDAILKLVSEATRKRWSELTGKPATFPCPRQWDFTLR